MNKHTKVLQEWLLTAALAVEAPWAEIFLGLAKDLENDAQIKDWRWVEFALTWVSREEGGKIRFQKLLGNYAEGVNRALVYKAQRELETDLHCLVAMKLLRRKGGYYMATQRLEKFAPVLQGAN